MRPIDLLKLSAAMKGHFRLRRFESKGGVPRSALWTVKSATRRVCIGEGCVHDVSVRDSKHQLVDADARQQTRLPEYTTVCRALELRKKTEIALFVNQSR